MITSPASITLALVLLATLLVWMGKKARKRRSDAELGNDFLKAIKDKEYCRIIIGMVVLFIVAGFYVFNIV